MFWIGFIVGMFVLALIAFVILVSCMKLIGVSWKDYANLVEANEMALINRDSRIEVYCEDTGEKVFEAGFKYPWDDEFIEVDE